ncbi:hypothetical protein FC19_GL001136 [Liquorilactobacillus aquaticus DSM 21051]|uniref:NAD-dependent epimerase/dehydratase domain-containing protein n=1 Tax=Liquorilactobacillus aquaticus DSM 21051 TaxID=1423725 RepID=A0A0R2D2F3_9LACO|nr:SDR family oxidoreductase [Liquorilactobacillus aquaticus]KRM96068.1 hypothetical protein FC19_GL001136 [Liquorilactobacillus aquaticus DSM 21051]
MRIFITGATGFIGSAVTANLLKSGHEVVGLARSDRSAESLTALGAKVHRGSLEDLDSLKSGAAASDGVIHLAFDNGFSDFEGTIANDFRAITAIGEALSGSGKPFVAASVTTMLNSHQAPATEDLQGTENTPGFPRYAAEKNIIDLSKKGVRSSVVRLPPCVHDETRQGFATALKYLAQEKGISAYVAKGDNRWPAVHRSDAARLFQLALESAPAGTVLHGVGETGIEFSKIAEVIGRHSNIQTTSISKEKTGEHFAWLSPFVTFDNPASSLYTQQLLNWEPKGPTLLHDIEHQKP